MNGTSEGQNRRNYLLLIECQMPNMDKNYHLSRVNQSILAIATSCDLTSLLTFPRPKARPVCVHHAAVIAANKTRHVKMELPTGHSEPIIDSD